MGVDGVMYRALPQDLQGSWLLTRIMLAARTSCKLKSYCSLAKNILSLFGRVRIKGTSGRSRRYVFDGLAGGFT